MFSMLNIPDSEIELFVWAIGGLVLALGSMAGYIVHLHKVIIKLGKDNAELAREYAENSTRMSLVIENNTRTIERVLDKFDR